MGRAPCEWLNDGSKRWAITIGFNVSTVIKGDLQVANIEIAPDWGQNSDMQLQEGALYYLALHCVRIGSYWNLAMIMG